MLDLFLSKTIYVDYGYGECLKIIHLMKYEYVFHDVFIALKQLQRSLGEKSYRLAQWLSC